MGIQTDNAPSAAYELERERAFAFRKQLRKGLTQIAGIVMVAGDYPTAIQPVAERLAEHLVGFQRLILR